MIRDTYHLFYHLSLILSRYSSTLFVNNDRLLEFVNTRLITDRDQCSKKQAIKKCEHITLKKYKEKHGNCNVSTRSGSLGSWVSNQRTQYWLSKEEKSSAMSTGAATRAFQGGEIWNGIANLYLAQLN